VQRGILSRAAEFACFRGIFMYLRNSVLDGDKGCTNTAYFGPVLAAVEN